MTPPRCFLSGCYDDAPCPECVQEGQRRATRRSAGPSPFPVLFCLTLGVAMLTLVGIVLVVVVQ